MTGIEPWISGAGSDRFGNCVTTTALIFRTSFACPKKYLSVNNS